MSYAYEFLFIFNLAIITLAERLIHLYIKANKNFLPSVIEIHIFLHYIFQINTCSTKYDNKMSDKRKWVVRVLLSISLQRASLKRDYSDRFFNNKQCQSMSSFVSSPASEFGLIFFIAGWF